MVLACRDNHEAAVTIPAGAVIELIGPVESDDRFVAIRSGDELFHIFASDLASRADRFADGEKVRGFSEESPVPQKKAASAGTAPGDGGEGETARAAAVSERAAPQRSTIPRTLNPLPRLAGKDDAGER